MSLLPIYLWVVSTRVLLAGTSSERPRTWTDAAGGHSIEAEIVEVTDGSLRLRKADGTTVDVPLANLSAADRDYPISWQSAQVRRRATAMVKQLKGHWAIDKKKPEKPLMFIDINPYHRSYGVDRGHPYRSVFTRRYPKPRALKPGEVLPLASGIRRATDVDLADLKGLTSLQMLDLSHNDITDAGLENLRGLDCLTTLDLSFTGVTDAGLQHLKGLTALTTLKLYWTGITDKGEVHRSAWPSSRGVPTKRITDEGLVHLAGLKNLRTLDLSLSQVTDAGVKKLQVALPDCKITLTMRMPQ